MYFNFEHWFSLGYFLPTAMQKSVNLQKPAIVAPMAYSSHVLTHRPNLDLELTWKFFLLQWHRCHYWGRHHPTYWDKQKYKQVSETVISSAGIVHSGVLTLVAVVFCQVQPLLPPLSLIIPTQFLEQWLVWLWSWCCWLCTSTRIKKLSPVHSFY